MELPKIAKRIRKKLKTIDIESITKYLNSKKYTTMYIGTAQGDTIICTLGLEEYITRKAFTYNSGARFVFVQNDMSESEKQYLLLHELCHIELGHTDDNQILNSLQKERQAEALAYYVETPTKFNVSKISSSILMFLVGALTVSAGIINFAPQEHLIAVQTIQNDETETISILNDSGRYDEYVFITPKGSCFHKEGCRYLDENAIEIEQSKIEKTHQPCSVCHK